MSAASALRRSAPTPGSVPHHLRCERDLGPPPQRPPPRRRSPPTAFAPMPGSAPAAGTRARAPPSRRSAGGRRTRSGAPVADTLRPGPAAALPAACAPAHVRRHDILRRVARLRSRGRRPTLLGHSGGRHVRHSAPKIRRHHTPTSRARLSRGLGHVSRARTHTMRAPTDVWPLHVFIIRALLHDTARKGKRRRRANAADRTGTGP